MGAVTGCLIAVVQEDGEVIGVVAGQLLLPLGQPEQLVGEILLPGVPDGEDGVGHRFGLFLSILIGPGDGPRLLVGGVIVKLPLVGGDHGGQMGNRDIVHAFILGGAVPADDPVGVVGDIPAYGVHHLCIFQGRGLAFGLLQRLGVGFGEDLADGIVYRADVFHDLRVIVEDGLLPGVRRVQAAEDHRWEQRDEKNGQGQQGDSHDCQFLFEGLHSLGYRPRKSARCRALGDVGDCLAYFGGALHLLGSVQRILQAAGLSVIWHG